eukprot:1630923-Prymnesium_polylepis.2
MEAPEMYSAGGKLAKSLTAGGDKPVKMQTERDDRRPIVKEGPGRLVEPSQVSAAGALPEVTSEVQILVAVPPATAPAASPAAASAAAPASKPGTCSATRAPVDRTVLAESPDEATNRFWQLSVTLFMLSVIGASCAARPSTARLACSRPCVTLPPCSTAGALVAVVLVFGQNRKSGDPLAQIPGSTVEVPVPVDIGSGSGDL